MHLSRSPQAGTGVWTLEPGPTGTSDGRISPGAGQQVRVEVLLELTPLEAVLSAPLLQILVLIGPLLSVQVHLIGDQHERLFCLFKHFFFLVKVAPLRSAVLETLKL